MRKALLITSILLIFVLSAYAQSSKKEEKQKLQEEQYQHNLNLINSQNFEFVARTANPQRGRQIDLTTNPNFLRIQSEEASAHIPYFGRAFSGGYSSSDGGIKFKGPFETYDVTKNDKKRRITINFRIKGEGDTFTCTLTLSGKESGSLSVISSKRQTISYTGTVRAIKEE